MLERPQNPPEKGRELGRLVVGQDGQDGTLHGEQVRERPLDDVTALLGEADAHAPPVVGVGPALDQPSPGQPVREPTDDLLSRAVIDTMSRPKR
jgi:hypothetical protein